MLDAASSVLLFSISSCHFLCHLLIYFLVFLMVLLTSVYSPFSSSINQSSSLPLLRIFSKKFFPWRGGWPHTKPPTWRTRVCIRFAPLDRFPSPWLWTEYVMLIAFTQQQCLLRHTSIVHSQSCFSCFCCLENSHNFYCSLN